MGRLILGRSLLLFKLTLVAWLRPNNKVVTSQTIKFNIHLPGIIPHLGRTWLLTNSADAEGLVRHLDGLLACKLRQRTHGLGFCVGHGLGATLAANFNELFAWALHLGSILTIHLLHLYLLDYFF
jgi:hypothetical protein